MELVCNYLTERGNLRMRMPLKPFNTRIQDDIERVVSNGRGYDPYLHSIFLYRGMPTLNSELQAVLDFMNKTTTCNSV